MANGERKSFIDPGLECTPVIGNFDSCFATSSRIGHKLRFACRDIRPFPCSFDLALPTLIITLDWFPTMIFRGCCEVSTPGRKKGESGGNSTGLSALTTRASDPLGHFLHQLLQKQGQPKGILTPASGSLGEIKFRWSVPPGQSRPCNTARIWRPSQAEHKSNRAWVSVTHQGEVNLICLHPQCLHRGCSN